MDEVELDLLDVKNVSGAPPLGSLTTLCSGVAGEARASRDTLKDYIVVDVNDVNGGYTGDDERGSDAKTGEYVIVDDGGGSAADGDGRDHHVWHSADDSEGRDQSSTSSGDSVDRWPILAGTEDSHGGHYYRQEDDKEEQAVSGALRDLPCPQDTVVVMDARGADTSSSFSSSSSTSGTTDDEDKDDDSDSDLSDESLRGSYMSPDSQDEYDLVRTLRHYRRRRRRPSDSSATDSNCSCESCVSKSNWEYFDSEEGPPGGERTIYRRATNCMDRFKYLLRIVIYGSLIFSAFNIALSALSQSTKDANSKNSLYWTVPQLVGSALVALAWHISQWILLRKGYGKGQRVVDRWYLIQCAQTKGLVYSVRGAIYAPTRPNPKGSKKVPLYEVVAYESEYHSSSYFDSDLEEDGQYRRSITPWREAADAAARERRNIYTRKAWFRDVPIIWWEMLTEPPRYL